MVTIVERFATELSKIKWPTFDPKVAEALIPFIEAVEAAKAEKEPQ